MDLRPSTLKALFLEGMRQANEGDEPEVPETPPPPAEPPAPPVVPAARIGREATGAGHNVPNWWDKDKTMRVSADGDDTGCTHPNPRTARVGNSDQYVPYWCPDCKSTLTLDGSAPTPAKAPSGPPSSAPALEKEDQEDGEPGPDDDDQDDEDEAGEEGGDGPAPARAGGSRWLYGSGKKRYGRPVYAQKSGPKQSLLESWGALRPTTRHGLYNGAALGLGFWVGVPQFFTAEVAHLVTTYHSWTALYVWFWYFVAGSIWALDYKAQSWLPPLSFLARVPLVSMIIGALLYGGTSAL